MNLIALVKPTGEIASVITPAGRGMYDEGATYGGLTARTVPPGVDESTALDTYVWTALGWAIRPGRPGVYHRWIDNAWVFDIDTARREYRAQIDTAAGVARQRYITIVPGQEATYSAKYEDARRYLDNTSPVATDYPWVNAEAIQTGMSLHDTAVRIATLGDLWHNVLGPAIEGIRISGKDALDSITEAEPMAAHVQNVLAQLEGV